jgi:hypothetical protein
MADSWIRKAPMSAPLQDLGFDDTVYRGSLILGRLAFPTVAEAGPAVDHVSHATLQAAARLTMAHGEDLQVPLRLFVANYDPHETQRPQQVCIAVGVSIAEARAGARPTPVQGDAHLEARQALALVKPGFWSDLAARLKTTPLAQARANAHLVATGVGGQVVLVYGVPARRNEHAPAKGMSYWCGDAGGLWGVTIAGNPLQEGVTLTEAATTKRARAAAAAGLPHARYYLGCCRG